MFAASKNWSLFVTSVLTLGSEWTDSFTNRKWVLVQRSIDNKTLYLKDAYNGALKQVNYEMLLRHYNKEKNEFEFVPGQLYIIVMGPDPLVCLCVRPRTHLNNYLFCFKTNRFQAYGKKIAYPVLFE